jgi:hypothetical protein
MDGISTLLITWMTPFEAITSADRIRRLVPLELTPFEAAVSQALEARR